MKVHKKFSKYIIKSVTETLKDILHYPKAMHSSYMQIFYLVSDTLYHINIFHEYQ